MTTVNAVDTTLSGQTGTGNFVGSNSPSIITPDLDTPSALILTNATGDQIGTNTNNNAASGHVGEFISSVIPFSSSVSFANDTFTDLTFISLSAGDWTVFGNIFYVFTGGGASSSYGWISSVSATQPDVSIITGQAFGSAILGNWGFCVPSQRISIASTTTIYISGICVVNAGTISASGGIYARRAR